LGLSQCAFLDSIMDVVDLQVLCCHLHIHLVPVLGKRLLQRSPTQPDLQASEGLSDAGWATRTVVAQLTVTRHKRGWKRSRYPRSTSNNSLAMLRGIFVRWWST
jgi:hypothetical protein